jgi:hypothetical protein
MAKLLIWVMLVWLVLFGIVLTSTAKQVHNEFSTVQRRAIQRDGSIERQ